MEEKQSPSKRSRLSKTLNTFSNAPFSFPSGETNINSWQSLGNHSFQEQALSIQAIKINILIKDKENSHNKKNDEKKVNIHTINLNIDNSVCFSSVVKQSIDEFNHLFEENHEEYRLSLNTNCYKLKPSKKNGKPNNDYPCIDRDTAINETGVVNFSLIYDEVDLIRIKKSESCCKCIII